MILNTDKLMTLQRRLYSNYLVHKNGGNHLQSCPYLKLETYTCVHVQIYEYSDQHVSFFVTCPVTKFSSHFTLYGNQYHSCHKKIGLQPWPSCASVFMVKFDILFSTNYAGL